MGRSKCVIVLQNCIIGKKSCGGNAPELNGFQKGIKTHIFSINGRAEEKRKIRSADYKNRMEVTLMIPMSYVP
jgi:hypothetical protein